MCNFMYKQSQARIIFDYSAGAFEFFKFNYNMYILVLYCSVQIQTKLGARIENIGKPEF